MSTLPSFACKGQVQPRCLGRRSCLTFPPRRQGFQCLSAVRHSRSAAKLCHLGCRCNRCCSSFHTNIVCGLVSHPEERQEQQDGFPSYISIPTRGMAKGLGSFGGATLERSKLDTRQKQQQVSPRLDNDGGGGNIGKGNVNGGGGEGDDGDDDDYFGEGDDGDGDGDNFFRKVIAELYDPKSIEAVLQEWFRHAGTLPLIIRQSVGMGLFSSAALVRFFSMDVRPNMTRAVTRCFSPSVSREVVGRLMADPAFAQKMVIEQAITIAGSLLWETRQRGKRFFKELDLVAINTLTLAACQASLVWLVSPTRSFGGAVQRMPWQRLISELPNHAFESSTKFHQFSVNQRLVSVLTKAAELAAVGTLGGAAMWGLSNGTVKLRRQFQDPEFTPSVPIPNLQHSVGGMAASMALVGNARYQTICGVDRWLFDHSSQLWSYLFMSGICRLAGHGYVSEPARLTLMGLPIGGPPSTSQPFISQQPLSAVSSASAVTSPSSTDLSPSSAPSEVAPRPKRVKKKKAKGFEMSLQ